MDEYINRKALLAEIAVDHGDWLSCNDTDELYRQGVEDNYSDTIRLINEMPAANVQPAVDTENMATVSDEFICKKCGIYLKNYIRVVMDEDNEGYIDEQHYDYEPKYCPECGAEVRDCDTND